MVKNLIFDLGGVILDLGVPQTITGFAMLSGLSPEIVTELFKGSEGFLAFEKGTIGEYEFRNFVRELYNVDATDLEIDECWNAMLLGIPKKKLDLLTRLKSQYRTFLLSNTNTIHLDYLNEKLLPTLDGVTSLDEFFHKTYYSHLMAKRKPEPEIFLQVLEENNLKASETLFLDDNMDNVEGARAVGLQAVYVDSPDFILQYFHEHRTA